MSYLAQTLEELLGKKRLKAADLHRLTGISEAQISKWLNGTQPWISEEHLTKISKALTSDPIEQATLVAAHCKDERYGPGAHLVQITVAGSPPPASPNVDIAAEEPPPYGAKLASKDEHALKVIAEHMPKNKDIRSHIRSMASLLEKGRLP